MKKIFFPALVAVAAISGAATTSQAVIFYPEGSSNPIICEELPITNCTSGLEPTINYYSGPNSTGCLVNVFFTYADFTRSN